MEDASSDRKNKKYSGSFEFEFFEGGLTYKDPSTGDERKLPVIDIIQENGASYRLSWLNTTIRLHSQEGDEQFNHIEVRTRDNELLAIQSDKLLERLVEKKFPSSEVPWVEPQTRRWYEGLYSKLGISAIEEFLQNG